LYTTHPTPFHGVACYIYPTGNFGLTEKCNTEKVKRKCKGGLKMVQAEKKEEQENATTTELARPNIYTQERNS